MSTESPEIMTTLAARGTRLPIGDLDATGKLQQTFELTPYTYAVEEELGAIIEAEPEMPINVYASEVIGCGVAKIGDKVLGASPRAERRIIVRNLFFADALYLYVWIRINALGYAWPLKPFKHSCGKLIEGFVGDLRTLEVKCADAVPRRTVTLEQGVVYGGKRLTEFVVGPVRWAMMETDDPGFLTNPAKFKLITLQNGVCGLKGAPEGPVYLTAEHLRTMVPREINRLVREIDQCGGGLVMKIEDLCPHCQQKFSHEINWMYNHFFATSSP